MGKERLVEEYKGTLSTQENQAALRYTLAVLSCLDKDFNYKYHWDKYILDGRDFTFLELDGGLKEANKRVKIALPEFMKYGLVFSEMGDVC